MEDLELNRSHDFTDMERRETTDQPVRLIGKKSKNGVRVDFNSLFGNPATRVAAICTLLPPPPIPPSLESSPERLRNIFTNSSCWKKYTELCTVNVPIKDSSSRTRMDDLHGNMVKDAPVGKSYEDGPGYSAVTRLLPFLAAITVGLVMLGVVALAYFWQQRKRRKYSCTVKYRNQSSPSRDYCSPGFYLTPSVTMETQLSLCALEDSFQNGPYSIYKDDVWPCSFDISHSTAARPTSDSSNIYESISSTSCRSDNEILLHPDQLLDENNSEPIYTHAQNIYCDNFNSSHPLPVEFIKEEQSKIKNNSQRKRLKLQERFTKKHEPRYSPDPVTNERNSPYVQIQSLKNTPNQECIFTQPAKNINQTPISQSKTRRGVIKKCRDAGNRVLDKLPWKSGDKSNHQPSVSQKRRLDRPIRAIRRSLKGLRSLDHQRLQQPTETCTIPAQTDICHDDMVLPSPASYDDHN